ncbi:MAG: DNA polymerase III subunit beta [Bacteroidaceae bacterium]|jgi:DNA polymerase-3 subunit beta|nr:DNA polymerase III subunit beta [Bacteroidaceae bacterium]
MRFNVSSTSLSNRLQTISRVQSSKNALPILDCILFELADGVLKMTASDSETTMVTKVEISDAEGEGKFAIGAKQLISSVKEISEQPITFTIDENTYAIEVNYQNGKYNLIGQNGYEFPVPSRMADGTRSIAIDSQVMLNGISRCLFAAADDELRPQMNGVYFDMTPESLTFVASDGHKLVRNRVLSVHADEPSAFILPKKPALLLKTVLPKAEGEVIVRFDDRNAEIQLTDYVISCRLIEGRYPNYNSVIPQDNPFRVTADRLAFISALRRVSVFASQSSALIKVHVDQGTLTVSAQDLDFSTSAEEHIMCDYDGMAMSIGFNGPFLIDVLNSITSNDVVLELADPSRAGVILPAEQDEDEDLIMLLMPMMLKD